MARIPQEEIDRIKRDVPVASLVRARGVTLRQRGENLVGLCPFHDDHEPSLIITPAKNLWHCMGACQTGGDVFAWVMKAEGLHSFRHAYELLTGGAPTQGSEPVVQWSTVPKLGSPFTPEMTNEEVLLATVDYYVETGKRAPEFHEYLKKRGLDSEEAIAHFRIGFANRTLGLRLPNANRREGMKMRERLMEAGVFRMESGHEHLNGSMVIPIFDERGNVVEMYGRKITPNLRTGTPLHLYLPGPHRGVWNLAALRETKEVILCEALIDALTFWIHGFRNVTASYGVQGFTDEHLAAFKAYGIERVLIAYDHDDAGNHAAELLGARLIAEGFEVYRIEFPKGMDANEYALKMTPADKALGLAIRTATLMGKGSPRVSEPRTAPAPAVPIETPHVSDTPLAHASAVVAPPPPAPRAITPPIERVIELPPPVAASCLAASPVAESDAGELPMETRGEDIFVTFGDRTYRIRGMKKNTSFDSLRINVMLTRASVGAVYLDTFDLAVARQRTMFEKQAAQEIGVKEEVLHREMGRILCALERVRDREIEQAREPKAKLPEMTQDERAAAIAYLTGPNLLGRIVDDLTRCGLVGESTNKLLAYLAATSRKLDRPLAIIIQSSSAAGKTTLMDAVLGCMPPEEVIRYSAITGKALFYIPDPGALKHKVLAISEEQGAEQATYALKLLQSEGKLSIASTGKDPHTGRLESQEYHVEGPIMPIMTTTAPEVDEELQNRCIVLTADEDREQTRAIHQLQRASQTIEGLIAAREANGIQKLHQNAQRLLRPVLVANPHAEALTFLDAKTRTRRDHMKYLTLIRTIALMHQYQRPRKLRTLPNGERIEYIEAAIEDIALANELAHEVLGRSLDELAPQTRKLLNHLVTMSDAECARLSIERSDYRFWQRDVRDFTGWPDYQVKLHMRKLVDMEYVLVHRGGRGQSFVYELLYRGEGEQRGRAFLMGLVEVEKLRGTTEKRDSSPANRDSEKRERSNSGAAEEHPKDSRRAAGAIAGNTSAEAASSESETQNEGNLMFPKPERQKTKSYKLRRNPGNGRDHGLLPRAAMERE